MASGARTAPVPCSRTAIAARSEFPGCEEYVGRVRQWLREVLGACPASDDATLLASELVTNALVHSTSGHGGTLTVTISHRSVDLRVEVTDQGGPWMPDSDADGMHGRGLVIVASIARAWGVMGDDSGRTVWFELDCP